MAESLHPATVVHTEVRRHPSRGGWAVFAFVCTEVGSVLYASHEHFVLPESAERYQEEKLDPAIEAKLKLCAARLCRGEDPDLFFEVEALDLLERLPTRWAPKQFEAI